MIPVIYPNINELSPDKELVTHIRKKRTTRMPPYRMVALQGNYKNTDFTSEESTDFFSVLLALNTKGQKAFLELHKAYDTETGISLIHAAPKTATQRKDFSNGFKELESIGLAKKAKKEHYILNPRMYINPKVYELLLKIWDNLP